MNAIPKHPIVRLVIVTRTGTLELSDPQVRSVKPARSLFSLGHFTAVIDDPTGRCARQIERGDAVCVQLRDPATNAFGAFVEGLVDRVSVRRERDSGVVELSGRSRLGVLNDHSCDVDTVRAPGARSICSQVLAGTGIRLGDAAPDEPEIDLWTSGASRMDVLRRVAEALDLVLKLGDDNEVVMEPLAAARQRAREEMRTPHVIGPDDITSLSFDK